MRLARPQTAINARSDSKWRPIMSKGASGTAYQCNVRQKTFPRNSRTAQPCRSQYNLLKVDTTDRI